MRYELEWSAGIVRAVQKLTPTIHQIDIVPAHGARLYTVGSHINVEVMVDERPDTRSYSLIGEHAVDGAYRIAVRVQADGRGGSRYMSNRKPGYRISISQPQNFFELSMGRPHYLLLAAGIGVTPMVGMAQRLFATRASFRMLYAAHTRQELVFGPELKQQLGDRMEICISDEGHRIDLAKEFRGLPPNAEAYLCGPLRLLDEARSLWQELGLPTANLRFETFGSSGRFARQAFEVDVRDLDRHVVVPENKTMLEALSEAGVAVMSDCMRGECGLCVVDVLAAEGPIDHRDVFLSEEQKRTCRQICVCVSRMSGGRLTIDTGFRASAR